MPTDFSKPDRKASGREHATDPDPAVSITTTIAGENFVINVDSIEYMQGVLSALIQALRGEEGCYHSNASPIGSVATNGKEFDVFISHASEDKDHVADELVSCLRMHGVKVWYDTDEILWGDSMRERMDEGLKKSRYGIVILSPDYIKEEKYWTKGELDALFQQESATGNKSLLPIWHRLSKDEVLMYSPLIASKRAMTTANNTIEEIANAVVKIVHRTK